jgi:Domain of unknown function (DUF4177)
MILGCLRRQVSSASGFFLFAGMRGGSFYMQWEYKLVALGLLVDATEPHQREKHEQILNDLGREGWEAVAYAAQSDTVLLKRPAKHAADRKPTRQRR